MVDTVRRELGPVDLLVNNAGIAGGANIEDTTLAMWQKNIDILATGYFLVARESFKLLKKQGKTILFSTHNLAEADALADRFVVISHGHVVADGTPEEIKATVAARTVRLVTDAPAAALAAVPGVRRVEVAAGESDDTEHPVLVVQTTAPEDLLARLFAEGRRVEQLSVTDTDLETAFIHLVGTPAASPAGSTTATDRTLESAS